MTGATLPADETAEAAAVPRRRRSGTETRRRSRLQIGVRLDALEHEAIVALAKNAGMSLPDFLRWAALGKRGRIRRAPETDDAVRARLLRELLGHVGQVGNNINQLARHANAAALGGEPVEIEVELLQDLKATITAWKTELRGILGTREISD